MMLPVTGDRDPAVSDETLVEWAAEGDREAFEELVVRYQRRVTGFLIQLVGEAETARELTQEVFLRVWKALGRFDPRYRFSTWLFRIAHNLGIDHLRRRRVPVTSLQREDGEGRSLSLDPPDRSKDPQALLENTELGLRIARCIGELRPEYRELVVLRHLAGLSYQEIADLKSLPLGTVKNKLFRAHCVLRSALEEYR